jgi:hypothetical protein
LWAVGLLCAVAIMVPIYALLHLPGWINLKQPNK